MSQQQALDVQMESMRLGVQYVEHIQSLLTTLKTYERKNDFGIVEDDEWIPVDKPTEQASFQGRDDPLEKPQTSPCSGSRRPTGAQRRRHVHQRLKTCWTVRTTIPILSPSLICRSLICRRGCVALLPMLDLTL